MHLLSIVLTALGAATTTLALPPSSSNLSSRTNPSETTCAQSNGIASCCSENQKQKANSPAVLDILSKDPKLAGVVNILATIPLIGPLLVPVNAQVGVAQQCSSIGVLSVNPSFVKCEAVNVCCYNTNNHSPQVSSGSLINALNNNNIALCPNLSLL